MNKFGLPERTVNELLEYFKSKPGVEKVVVYGSRAKGNFRNGSDIDFAIWTDDKSAYELRIEAELDDLETPYMFDVTDYKNLSHEGMKNGIDRDGVLFYQKEN
ncbi:MAG: nucleotidyltransferase domain-containing protein [Candidatus Gastranaerophilales bacterium]|nr:nucleotidyltransferase domain-containing protein [Candidatus Gastranaerophilales bacterium]